MPAARPRPAERPDDGLAGTGNSKVQHAYDWLSGQISARRFGPGHRLVLSQIAEELGISVVPVREALRRLQAEGLVTYEPNIGATVAMPDAGEYADVMEGLSYVEGITTALSAPHLTADDLDQAQAINAQMRGLVATLEAFDPARFTRLNSEFHVVLYARCPNRWLRAAVERAWSRLDALRESTFSFIPVRATASVKEHDQILQAIRDGLPFDDLERLARDHRLRTLHTYQQRRQQTEQQ